jgi:hypothetical protein
MKEIKLILILSTLSFLIIGCQTQKNNPSPTQSSIQNPSSDGYPAPVESQVNRLPAYPAPKAIRSTQTAFDSYLVAEIAAKKWDPKVELYQIPSTFQTENIIGQSMTGEGWFFLFKIPASPLEYYVYVSNGIVSGTAEAQPVVLGGKPTHELQPLPDLKKLINSDKLLELFDQHGGAKYKTDNPNAVLNPDLTYLTTDSFPIWRIFDVSTPKETIPLFTVNALTGQVLPNK